MKICLIQLIPIKEFKYVYLFVDYNINILNPSTHFDDAKDENTYIANKEIQDKIIEFKESNLNIEVLINYFKQNYSFYFGQRLGAFWSQNLLDKNLFEAMINNKADKIAIDYLKIMAQKDLKPIQEIIKHNNFSSDFLIELYRIEATFTKETPYINNEKEEIKKEFWKKDICCDQANKKWAVEECGKYGDLRTYVCQLYDYVQSVDANHEELYDFFIDILNIETLNIFNDGLSTYYFKELLNKVQDYFINDELKADKIGKIELRYYMILSWEEMRCIKKQIVLYPDLYAEIIDIAFKHEDGEKKYEDNLIYVMYNLYNKIKFCPCVDNNNNLDKIALDNWLTTFKELLANQKQTYLFNSTIGRLFSYSPKGKDGYYPCEEIREYIESHQSKELIESYAYEILNSRSAYFSTDGVEEKELANKYNDCYRYIKQKYPFTAKIYKLLTNYYNEQAERERYEAENRF